VWGVLLGYHYTQKSVFPQKAPPPKIFFCLSLSQEEDMSVLTKKFFFFLSLFSSQKCDYGNVSNDTINLFPHLPTNHVQYKYDNKDPRTEKNSAVDRLLWSKGEIKGVCGVWCVVWSLSLAAAAHYSTEHRKHAAHEQHERRNPKERGVAASFLQYTDRGCTENSIPLLH
jgi:hypothetical protein